MPVVVPTTRGVRERAPGRASPKVALASSLAGAQARPVTTSAYLRAGNQPPPLEGYDLFSEDRPLVDALRREGAAQREEECAAFGRLCGGEPLELGRLANENPPVLRAFDRVGERIDEVEFHPAWHELLRIGVEAGVHASPWTDADPGAHVARAARFLTLAYAEAGVGCPLSMTYAVVPALRADRALASEWEPGLAARVYEPGLRPPAEKAGVLAGMALTERQGGSDVRANETRAEPLAEGGYALSGHKWFCSAPMCDAFLVLAHAPGGLTCFLLPRVLPDGERNGFHLERLKDKLGNRSNASAELELRDAWATRLGEEGRGVATIIEMVVHTRLDCVLGSTALMRRAVAEATHHAAFRSAFGRLLSEQPLHLNVLADLCLDSEAATATALRLARSVDEDDRTFRRLATAVSKYWICKSTPPLVAEALECIGGNGYVEESALPRLFRESPLNSLWEGAGNVNALDLLRAAAKEPESIEALLDEIALASGGDVRLDEAAEQLRSELADAEELEFRARRVVELAGLCLQASLLVRHAPSEVADAFCATRLGGEGGRAYGTLPRGIECPAIVERHRPRVEA
jgi:putative acyl-CoA dehydrogenase